MVFPMVEVLAAHWFFHVSLPTLTFISFLLLFAGSLFCYPVRSERQPPTTEPSHDTRSEAAILLIAGHATGLAVLILFFVRLFSQGLHFSWT